MELSKFTNGDKKVIIQREDYNYTLYYYLKNKIINKETTADFNRAESMAEEFILEGKEEGPSFLVED